MTASDRYLKQVFERTRIERGLSIRQFAAEMETSISQAQKVLGKYNKDSSMTLSTVIKAARVLGLRVRIEIEKKSLDGQELPL